MNVYCLKYLLKSSCSIYLYLMVYINVIPIHVGISRKNSCPNVDVDVNVQI